MFKEYSYVQRYLQHLGCWNRLDKLAEMTVDVLEYFSSGKDVPKMTR